MRGAYVVLLALVLIAAAQGAHACDGAEKTAICHKTGDGQGHSIIVSECSMQAHLGHGDRIGECQPNEACVHAIVSDKDTVLPNGSAASAAWQPVNGRFNTFWDSRVDFRFTPAASWIWSAYRVARPADGDTVMLEREFTLAKKPKRATLHITADNGYEASVNGERIGSAQLGNGWQSSNLTEAFVHTSGWQSVEHYDVARQLRAGENTLVIAAANEYFGPADNQERGTREINPAGVIFELDIEDCDGQAGNRSNGTSQTGGQANQTGNQTQGSGTAGNASSNTTNTNPTGNSTSGAGQNQTQHPAGGTNQTNDTAQGGTNQTGSLNQTTGLNQTNGTAQVNSTAPPNTAINITINATANATANITTNATPNPIVPENLTSSTGDITPNSTAPGGNGSGNNGGNGTNTQGSTQAAGPDGGSITQSAISYATMGGYCNTGWHKEDGKCVRDPEPEEQPIPAAAPQGLDLTTPQATAPPQLPAQPLDLAALDDAKDPGNLLTGNVVGAGKSSIGWLLALIAMVVVGLGYYAYRKK